jgi:hypothetical protein
MKYHSNSGELQTEVERFIYTGMTVQKAKKILQDNSFSCGYYKNRSFSMEHRDKNGNQIRTNPITPDTSTITGDYLSCQQNGFLRTSDVILLYKNNVVTLVEMLGFVPQPNLQTICIVLFQLM